MASSRLITLLTDFGLSDVYVGVMKGAIFQINPTLKVVDLTHEISPQKIAAARFCIMTAYPYFLEGTVHVAVVDPGVGSHRRAIALQTATMFLVGPDNGLFSGVLQQNPVITAVELTNPEYWRTPTPSSTFHGLDIFAPVGAHLARGVAIEELGEAIAPETLVDFPMPECVQTEARISGCIQYIDRFGNLVTNIPETLVQGKNWSAIAAGLTLPSQTTYGERSKGSAIALIGSHGWVEIAVSSGNAQSQLQLDWGASVQVVVS